LRALGGLAVPPSNRFLHCQAGNRLTSTPRRSTFLTRATRLEQDDTPEGLAFALADTTDLPNGTGRSATAAPVGFSCALPRSFNSFSLNGCQQQLVTVSGKPANCRQISQNRRWFPKLPAGI
jgi:hypothetical protein